MSTSLPDRVHFTLKLNTPRKAAAKFLVLSFFRTKIHLLLLRLKIDGIL